MKRELKHDILAQKIWERLPEQDKQLRQVRRSLEQRTTDYFTGKGSLAGATELASWQESLVKLQLAEKQREFLALSRQDVADKKAKEQQRLLELEAQAKREKQLRQEAEFSRGQAERQAKIAAINAQNAKRRTRIALGVSLVALVAFVIAAWQYRTAEIAREAALISRDSTTTALKLAEELQQEALDSARSAREQRLVAEDKQAQAEAALNAQLVAEEIARKERLDKLLSEAANYRSEARFEDALSSYQEAIGIAANQGEEESVQQQISETTEQKNRLEFERNRDIGLAMQAANYCTGALRYLKAALAIEPTNENIKKAIASCQE